MKNKKESKSTNMDFRTNRNERKNRKNFTKLIKKKKEREREGSLNLTLGGKELVQEGGGEIWTWQYLLEVKERQKKAERETW